MMMPANVDQTLPDGASMARYRVTGMDCPSCAAKIEKAARHVPGVPVAKVSMASQVLSLSVDDPTRLDDVVGAMRANIPKLSAEIRQIGIDQAQGCDYVFTAFSSLILLAPIAW